MKDAMNGFEDKRLDTYINGQPKYIYLNRYGALTTSNNIQVDGEISIQVYGPLSYQSNFYKEYKSRISAFKADNNL
jgi:hypothetical protein